MNESVPHITDPTPEEMSFGDIVRHQFEGDPARFESITTPEDVESAAFEILDSMPEGMELSELIQAGRETGIEATEAIRERGKLWRQISVEVSMVTGVEIEAAEHDAQKEAFRKNLGATLDVIDPEASDTEIMTKLGMIRPVPGDKGHVFTFPSRIFPPYVKEQWKVYTGMIEQFDDAKQKLLKGVITQQDFTGIDILRRKAHDTLAGSIGDILQFSEWDLEKYRHLVEKMVNEKFAEPTGEMATYAQLLKERMITPEHLTSLHKAIERHPSNADHASGRGHTPHH